MNKAMLSRALLAALVLWLWAAQSPPVARAHDGPPRVELVADQLSPGATLEVRGVNIAPEQQVTLALVRPNLEIPLGLTVGDQHGDFTAVFALPRTLEPGAYTVRVIGANRVIVGATLNIIGTGAVDDTEEGAQRDQDEPLLAALPQDGPASQPQTASLSATADEPTAIEPSFALAISLVVALVALIGVMIAIRRRMINAG